MGFSHFHEFGILSGICRANAFLLAWSALSFLSPILFYLFLLSMGWLCGVGVFGLIECPHSLPALHSGLQNNNNNNNIHIGTISNWYCERMSFLQWQYYINLVLIFFANLSRFCKMKTTLNFIWCLIFYSSLSWNW